MKHLKITWINGKSSKINLKFILLNILIISIMLIAFIRGDDSNNSSNPTLGEFNIVSIGKQWLVTKATGQESQLKFWKSGTDKKVELGWIPPNNNCAGWIDRYLYYQNDSRILDDKNKDIALKCETAKCAGMNCYHISLTTAQAVNIEEYVRLGESSIITEYQDLNMFAYDLDFGQLNITLSCDGVPQNDLFIYSLGEGLKFGANGTFEGLRDCTFHVASNIPLAENGISPYVQNPTPFTSGNLIKYTQYENHQIDFSDVCSRGFECYNDTYGEEICNISASCVYSYYNDTSYYYDIDFTTDKFIDPLVTIVSSVISTSEYTINITMESGNFTHLTTQGMLTAQKGFDLTRRINPPYHVDEDNSLLSLDGTGDYVTVATGSNFSTLCEQGCSFSAWVNKAEISTAGYILGRFDTAGNDRMFYMSIPADVDTDFQLSSNGTSLCTVSYSAGDIIAGRWYHIVATYYNSSGASNITVYRDGVNISTVICPFSGVNVAAWSDSEKTYIGTADETSILTPWNGFIDNVLFLNRSLTASEVSSLYALGRTDTTYTDASLVRAFRFDNTSDLIAVDSTGTMNGTFTGDAAYGYYTTGLLSYYNFDADQNNATGTVTTVYDFADDYNGVGRGNANVSADCGIYGQGACFDGAGDSISLGATVALYLIPSLNFTISVWFYNNKVADEQTVFGSGAGTRAIIGTNWAGQVIGEYYTGSSYIAVSSSSAIPANSWNHFVLVNGGGTLYGYLNGVLVTGTTTVSSHYATNACLGSMPDGTNHFFNGSIDDVMIFNRALNESEITAIYNNQSIRYYQRGEEIIAVNLYQDGSFDQLNITSEIQTLKDSNMSLRIGEINCSINTSGLVGYYNAESKNAQDFSGMNNHGITFVDNAFINETGGKNGAGFSFDGNGDGIRTGETMAFNPNGTTITLSWWFNSDNITDITAAWSLRDATGGSGYYIKDAGTTLKMGITMFDIIDADNYFSASWSAPSAYQAGTWEHRAIVINLTNGVNLTFYRNGTYLSSVNDSTGRDLGAGTFLFEMGLTNNAQADINLDEFMIFNRSLSNEEIQTLFDNQSSGHDGTPSYTEQLMTNGAMEFNISTESDFATIEYIFNGGFYSPIREGVGEDNPPPTITLNSPATNSNFNISIVSFNISLSETGSWCGLSISGSANITMTNTSGTAFNYTNSSIADGSYTFIVSCNDTFNNMGVSTSYNFLVDTVYPNINFTAPTPSNASTQSNNDIYVNVSVNDANNLSTFIDFDNSLVGWWRMDDVNQTGYGAKVYDYTGKNNGTAFNQSHQVDNGKLGKGFSFDGDGDYIDVGAINDSWTQFTACLWFKPNVLGTASEGLIGNRNNNGGFRLVRSTTSGGMIGFYAFNSTGTEIPARFIHGTLQPIYYHACGAFNGTTIRFYINGTNKVEAVCNGYTPASIVVSIGAYAGGTLPFNGYIDDVMIFNRSLSAEEIAALYTNQSSRYLTVNYTNLAEGTHEFKAYTQDLAGNLNSTELRTVTISLSDATAPTVSISPANITTTNQSILWNITFNEASNMSGYYGVCPLYSSSYFENSSILDTLTYYNGTLINSTTYCYNITSFCDSSNNCNTTGVIFNFSTGANIIVDITPPIFRTLVTAGNPSQLFRSNSNAYYRNGTKQTEDWMYISVNVTDDIAISNVTCEWKNSIGWYNFSMEHSTGNLYYINMTNQSTWEGYTFNIYANDTSGNLIRYNWTFVDYESAWGTQEEWRKYAGLNYPSNDSLTYKQFYIHKAPFLPTQIMDRALSHEQPIGPSGNDTGLLKYEQPTTSQELWCTSFVGGMIDETLTINKTQITNVYYHIWWGSDNYINSSNITFMFQKSWIDEYFTENAPWRGYYAYKPDGRANLTNLVGFHQINYTLETHLYDSFTSISDDNFTSNDINLLSVIMTDWTGTKVRTTHPSLISMPNSTSFVIFNVPDNDTLSRLDTDSDGLNDTEELYTYFTDPSDSDTDNGGENDSSEVDNGRNPLIQTDDIYGDATAPTVTLNQPPYNYYNDTLAFTYFNCTASDTSGIANISLYITNSTNSSFNYNLTNTSSPSNTFNVSYNLSTGNYTWNCLACDLSGNCGFAAANRSLSINYTYDIACISSWVNTSWTSYVNISECYDNDTIYQMSNLTQYDSTGCNTTNTTFYNYTFNGCNYCSYNIVNTSWTDELNVSCQITDKMQVMRNLTEYDSNYSTCYLATELASDLWNSGVNNTYYNYTNISSCNYCSYELTNTSQTSELNMSCQITDEMQVMRNWTEYDNNYSTCYLITELASDLWNSGNNITFYNYTNISSCNYCSYDVTNTSWTSWLNNTCLSNNTMNQSSNLTEYDSNYSTCYSITGIATDLWNSGSNNTYYQYNSTLSCNYLGCPNITNIINYSTTNESTRINFTASENVNYSIYIISWLNNNTFNITHNVYQDSLINGTEYIINLTVWDDYGCSTSNNTFGFTSGNNIIEVVANVSSNLVLNLTFDDYANPWKDYSIINHNFTTIGTVTTSNLDTCKYYGCINLSSAGVHYLNSTVNFATNNTIAWCAWIYPSISTATNTFGFFNFGIWGFSPKYRSHVEFLESSLGFDYIRTNQSLDELGTIFGYTQLSSVNNWHFLCFQQTSNGNMTFWRDASVISSFLTESIIVTNLTDLFNVGYARYGTEGNGFMDEILMWNASVLNTTYVTEMYDSKRLGTPPDVDAYLKYVKYDLLEHRNWSSKLKELDINTTFPINITIANAGNLNATNNFNLIVVLDGAELCNNIINISINSEQMVQCNWTTAMGFHQGYILLNISDDNNLNNNISLYIPYLNHPYWIFNQSDWELGFTKIASDPVTSYNYLWTRSFGTNDFNVGTTCDNADTQANNARNGATVCYLNNYTNITGRGYDCDYAINNILGYANIDPNTCTNVQSDHYYGQVILALDLMYNNMTETDIRTVVAGLENKCQKFTDMGSLQNDDSDAIEGDNGKGFGAGMGTTCYGIMGEYSQNPLTIQTLTSQYWGKSMYDMWMNREISYLRSFKNDSYSEYQEGMGYKFYSQYHLVDNLLYAKRFNIRNYSGDYKNAFCSMAIEMVKNTLDFNYNGKTLRNDLSSIYRMTSRGDSYSYKFGGADGGVDMLSYYGLLCDDINIKKDIVRLRELYLNFSGGANSNYGKIQEIFLWHLLKNQTGTVITEPSYKFSYDNANDIFSLRTNFTYRNDTLIQIDGGDERNGGHSQAQGYFLYALGEPFLDWQQVPYEDDVRMDTWKNGISLQNTTQEREGLGGIWNNNIGEYGYNQYYGSGGTTVYYSTDYPDYRLFPLAYGGDLEDYIGTSNAYFAGVFAWRPYYPSAMVNEYFVKYGDLLVKRTTVKGNTEGEVYHNFINIMNESDMEINTVANITFNRTRWDGKEVNLDINLIYSNTTFNIGGGATNISLCYAKTSCSGSSRGNWSYRRTYLYSETNDTDFIIAHHWYYSGQQVNQTQIGNIDLGVNQSNNIILYDMNGDNYINFTDVNATGWGLVYNIANNEAGAFNTTYIKVNNINLFSSTAATTVFIERSGDRIKLTANTMERSVGIDYPTTINVTIDAQELTNDSGFIVKKNGVDTITSAETGTLVNFLISTGQNSDYYIITSGGPDTNIPYILTSPTNISTNNSIYFTFACNENCNATGTYGLFPSYTGSGNFTNATTLSSQHFNITNLINSTYYGFNITSFCDSSGNCNTSGYIFNFSTSQTIIADITPPSYSNFTNNASIIKTGGVVNWSIYLSDVGGLSTYIFYQNDTGTWVPSGSGISGYNISISKLVTITAPEYSYICGYFYFDDIFGNNNITPNSCFTINDSSNPRIRLNSPLNNSWSNSNVTFKYNVTDNNLATCLLYHNATGWNINKTNSTITSGSQDSHSITLTESNYLWNVWCNDTLGNSAWNLTNYTIKIDTTPPTPCDSGALYYGASYGANFEYTCNSQDNRSGIYNYYINETGNFSINASGFVTNITKLQPHIWRLNVSINDSVGNINSVLWTINISDTSTPMLDISYPTTAYFQNLYWLNFSIREDFPANLSINDSRWILNFSNSTYYSFYNGSSQPEGNHTVRVQYNDTWGNEGFYNLTYVIDRTSPLTSLIAPPNMSDWTVSNLVIFTYNVTDTNPIDNCAYDVDSPIGGSGGSNPTITSNINQSFNYSLANANWEWYVNCTDMAGNWNSTLKWNVTVNYLAVGEAEIGGGALGEGSGWVINQTVSNQTGITKELTISRGVLLTSNITMLLALAFLMLVDNTKREEKKKRPQIVPDREHEDLDNQEEREKYINK